jgi:hemerythrin
MALINWHPSFSVQVEELDEQHQLLVKMINDLYDAMNVGKDKQILGKLINQLVIYATMHFAREEHYFEKYEYPEIDFHKEEHDDFEDKVSEFERDFLNGSQNLSHEIMGFLGKWLVNHIMGSDKKYGPWFNDRGLY